MLSASPSSSPSFSFSFSPSAAAPDRRRIAPLENMRTRRPSTALLQALQACGRHQPESRHIITSPACKGPRRPAHHLLQIRRRARLQQRRRGIQQQRCLHTQHTAGTMSRRGKERRGEDGRLTVERGGHWVAAGRADAEPARVALQPLQRLGQRHAVLVLGRLPLPAATRREG